MRFGEKKVFALVVSTRVPNSPNIFLLSVSDLFLKKNYANKKLLVVTHRSVLFPPFSSAYFRHSFSLRRQKFTELVLKQDFLRECGNLSSKIQEWNFFLFCIWAVCNYVCRKELFEDFIKAKFLLSVVEFFFMFSSHLFLLYIIFITPPHITPPLLNSL